MRLNEITDVTFDGPYYHYYVTKYSPAAETFLKQRKVEYEIKTIIAPIIVSDKKFDGKVIMISDKDYIKLFPPASYTPIDDLKPYMDIIKEYANSSVTIYRGMHDTGDFIIGDGNKLVRKSANTNNYVTLLSEVLPSWRDYPKRSKSFICSTDDVYASNFGRMYVVIPLENQPIAQLKNIDDFFDFPKNGFVPRINRAFKYMAEDTGIQLSETNSTKLYEQISEIFEKLKTMSVNRDELYNNIRDGGMKFINELLDPAPNTYLAKNFKNLRPFKGETWMSGKVLFIRYVPYKRLIDKLESV